MKLRAHVEGLAVVALFAAVLAKDTLVKITANETVNAVDADAVYVGRVVKPATEVNGEGTIETPFKERITIKADGAIAAGDRVKLANPSGGVQRVKKWVSQTDAAAGDKPDSLFGVCFSGGADGADVDIFVY